MSLLPRQLIRERLVKEVIPLLSKAHSSARRGKVEQTADVLKIVFQDRIRQRIFGQSTQFLVVPMPLLKEQLVEAFFFVSQDKIRLVEQIIEFAVCFCIVLWSSYSVRVVSARREVQFQ